MPRTSPFDERAAAYDAWFDRNAWAFESELEAIRAILPAWTRGVEVGAGTGRFAVRLGIPLGVEPSAAMARLAVARGIRVIGGVAERLPLESESFDLVLMVTTICFVDDIGAALREASRVLTPGGHLVLAFIDRESEPGRGYARARSTSSFYRNAVFRSAAEVAVALERAGLRDVSMVQTIFTPPESMSAVSPVEPGFGRGLFIVARGRRGERALPGLDASRER